MRLFATIALFGVLATACGSAGPTSTVPPEGSSPNRAAIYAVALHQLVSVDNTFGGDGNPWSELLVLASLDPSAGDATFGGGAPDPQQVRPLTAEERNAIEAALSPLAPIRWIDDADEWRTDDLMPVIPGSAILGVGAITFDDQAALVPMSMWCGGLCGTWFTYRVTLSDASWVVSGIEGPIAIS